MISRETVLESNMLKTRFHLVLESPRQAMDCAIDCARIMRKLDAPLTVSACFFGIN